MITLVCALLLISLLWLAALQLTPRMRHWWRVWFDQHLTTDERRALRWVGRFCYVWAMVWVGMVR